MSSRRHGHATERPDATGRRRSTACARSSPPGSATTSWPPTSPRTWSCAASPPGRWIGSTIRPPGCTGRPATPSSTTTAPAASTSRRSSRTWPDPDPSGDRAQRGDPRAGPLPAAAARGPPPTARDALTRVDLDGQTHQQAADQLGISVSGMKSRVQRARRQLEDLLTGCCPVDLDRTGAVTDYQASNPACSCSSDAAGTAALPSSQ